MRTAVETNVLFDLLAGDAVAADAASRLLASALSDGPVVICPVVYPELAAGFETQDELTRFLRELEILTDSFSAEALWSATGAWKSYARRRTRRVQCPRCGKEIDLHCPQCQSAIA